MYTNVCSMSATVYRYRDVEVVEVAAKSVLNRVRNMPFRWSINPYQGCYHQCVFCYARRTHAYRDLDGVNAWGNRIFAKVNAPAVVRDELRRPSWTNECVALGTATDPYQAIEGRYRITRGILTELERAATPVSIVTRSPLIVRDLDLLVSLAHRAAVSVYISLPTVDEHLAKEIEPTVAPPAQRLRTIGRLAQAGLRVGVLVAPVLPHLNDSGVALSSTIAAAADAGAAFVTHTLLYLGEVTRDAYFHYLEERHDDLLAPYRELYGATYAPPEFARTIAQRFANARQAIRFSPPPFIRPRANDVQLRLW